MIPIPLILAALGVVAVARARAASTSSGSSAQQQQQDETKAVSRFVYGDLPRPVGGGRGQDDGRNNNRHSAPAPTLTDRNGNDVGGGYAALPFAGANQVFVGGNQSTFDTGRVSIGGDTGRASGFGVPGAGASAPGSAAPGTGVNIGLPGVSFGPGIVGAIGQTVSGLIGIAAAAISVNPIGIVAGINNTVQGIVGIVNNVTATITGPATATVSADPTAAGPVSDEPGPVADAETAATAEFGPADEGAVAQSSEGVANAGTSGLGFSTPADATGLGTTAQGGPGGSPSNAAPGFTAGQEAAPVAPSAPDGGAPSGTPDGGPSGTPGDAGVGVSGGDSSNAE